MRRKALFPPNLRPIGGFLLLLKGASGSKGTEVKVRPMRSSLKPMVEIIKKFKSHMTPLYVNAMKESPFGNTFMAFYNEEFGADRGLKSNISVLKIVDQYNVDSRSFLMGGQRIKLTVEDIALTFGLPINGEDLILNKTCTLKERGFVKHFFGKIQKITKVSIENALDDLLVKKRKRTEQDVTMEEQVEQQLTLNEVIKDIQRLAAQDFSTLMSLYMSATLFFSGSKCTVPWYLVEQIANMQLMRSICWAKAVWQFLFESLDIFRRSTFELQGCSVQILYWFCERVQIFDRREGKEDKIPRAVRWDLNNISKALADINLLEIDEEKVLHRMANISEEEMNKIGLPAEVPQENPEVSDEAAIPAHEEPYITFEGDLPEKTVADIQEPRDEAAEQLQVLREENTLLRIKVETLEKKIEDLQKENAALEEKNKKRKEKREKRKLRKEQEEEKTRKRKEQEKNDKERERKEQEEKEKEREREEQEEKEKARKREEQEEKMREELEKRRKEEEDEEKRKRELEEKRGQKHLEDKAGGEYDLVIGGQDIPSFSLNLTQQIFELQRDNASEVDIQRRSPAALEFKKKSLDVTKGSIERGVKERKRVDRDREDSDFIYPKKLKKTCQETVPPAQAEFIDPEFNKQKEDEKQMNYRDLSESLLYNCLEPNKKEVVKNFFDKAKIDAIAYQDAENSIHISGKDVEDILFQKDIDSNVIHYYMQHVESRCDMKSIFFRSEAWHGVYTKNKELEEFYIKNKLTEWNSDTHYMFFPLNHKHNANEAGFHWTLLVFDCHTEDWIMYNSLVPVEKNSSVLKIYQADARNMKERVVRIFEEFLQKKLKKCYIKYAKCPQQKNSVDCAIYVCKFIEHIAYGSPSGGDDVTDASVQKLRADLSYMLLSDKQKSWDEETERIREMFFED